MRRSFPLALLVLLVIAPACGDDDPSPASPSAVVTPHVFVGKTDGGEALVALVEGNDAVVAYTCGREASFGTHTGWYFGPRLPEAGGAVEAVNGPSGLRLRAFVAPSGGEGTMTLADGRELHFNVEPARGSAGLFDHEDAGNFVGLIRTNDGATAGNAIVRVGSTGTLTTSPTSTPVTTTTTRPSPAPTTTTTTVAVSFDNILVPRTVNLTTVLVPDKRIIRRTGPVIIFFTHGMADNLGQKPTGAADDPVECAGPKDTPFYGRCEWGQDFLPGVFGSRDVRAQLSTLDGRDVTGDRFLNDAANRQPFDENVGKALAGDCVADTNQAERFDPRTAMHFVVPGQVRTPITTAPELIALPPAPPPLAAFVTWRDPTRGLVFSGRRLTRQIYAALRWYETVYRVTPGVILAAQSFGGLASRFVLSRPDPATLDAETNREGVRLCGEDLAKMSYIRDRTLYLVTLATPHEGSYLAEWGPPVKDALRALLTELRGGLASSPIAAAARGMQQIATLLRIASQPPLVSQLIASIDGFLPQLESAGALLDMQLARMEKINRGPLSPDKARRSAGAPILGAGGTLVPVYATLARSPGSNAFDSPDILKGFDMLGRKRPKSRGWITQTMLVSDELTRQLLPKGFGDATVAPYAEFRSILDRRARLIDSTTTTTALERAFSRDIADILATASPWFLGRFGNNGRAVLTSLLGSDPAVVLPHVAVPIHVDQKYRIGFQGTIDVPIPVLQCQDKRIPLDFDALGRLLVQRFGRTPNVLTAIAGRNVRQILETLAVLIAESDTFAQETARWFVGKVLEFESLPAECDASPDDVFDVFAAAEMDNWKIVSGTGRIPKPAWIGTGEPVSDGEMDTDGAVHSASALGFTLGRVPFYFEHNRTDDAGKIGSWYRIYDNPVTEKFNHGLQYENEVGLWIRDTFLARGVGPVPARDSFSTWVE